MITLVLGGTRSGKSEVAERLATAAAGADGNMTYLATGEATDEAMARRIAVHRARRPARWRTVEATGAALPAALAALDGTALVDSLGAWVASAPGFDVEAGELCAALERRQAAGLTVVVSEEVGLAVHPVSEAGRAFVDALGALNQAVAGIADTALLVVAGRVVPLDRLERA